MRNSHSDYFRHPSGFYVLIKDQASQCGSGSRTRVCLPMRPSFGSTWKCATCWGAEEPGIFQKIGDFISGPYILPFVTILEPWLPVGAATEQLMVDLWAGTRKFSAYGTSQAVWSMRGCLHLLLLLLHQRSCYLVGSIYLPGTLQLWSHVA